VTAPTISSITDGGGSSGNNDTKQQASAWHHRIDGKWHGAVSVAFALTVDAQQAAMVVSALAVATVNHDK